MTTTRTRIATTLILIAGVVFSWNMTVWAQASTGGVSYDTKAMTVPNPSSGNSLSQLLNETVDPATGSVVLNLDLPVAKGRLLDFPYSIRYASNQARQLVSWGGSSEYAHAASWQNFTTSGGWTTSLPYYTYNTSATITSGAMSSSLSDLFADFTFVDPQGGAHVLPIGASITDPGLSLTISSATGTDGTFTGKLTNSSLTVSAKNGTTYTAIFSDPGAVYSPPSIPTKFFFTTIEDTNGNLININVGNNPPWQPTISDTLGRTIVQTNGNNITASGITYGLDWTTTTSEANVPATNVSDLSYCAGVPNINDTQSVIHSISLPNSTSYTFYYGSDNPNPGYSNPYGLISEIDYPDGGWVRYTWKNADTMSEIGVVPAWDNGQAIAPCIYTYESPVLASRTVGFVQGGPAVLTETYTYSTNWGGNSVPNYVWTSKETDVVTQDLISGLNYLTVHKYASGGSVPATEPGIGAVVPVQDPPVETSLQVYSGSTKASGILRTTTTSWYLPGYANTEITTLDTGISSKVVNCYIGFNCAPNWGLGIPVQLAESDEYDYGKSAPTRKTLYSYQRFAGTLGVIANRECKVVIEDGTSTIAKEIDIYYDGGGVLCTQNAGVPLAAPPEALPPGTHDETNFGPSSTMPRGNATKVVQWGNLGPSPTTTFNFDETGQIINTTDPCGNINCADMSGTSHTTTYSYSDAFANGTGSPSCGSGACSTNAYLTRITYPNTGVAHTESYTWAFSNGLLMSHTDQNSNTTNFQYNDPLLRLKEVQGPPDPNNGGQQPTIQYSYVDGPSSPSVTTSTLQNTSNVWVTSEAMRDGMQHVVDTENTSDPMGMDTVATVYTGLGQLYSVTNPYRGASPPANSSTSYGYDPLGRKLLVTNPDNTAESWSYSGNSTTRMDEDGNKWKQIQDSFGRLTEVLEPNGSAQSPTMETDYAYDVLNNLVWVSQCGGSCTSTNGVRRKFQYDSLSRLVQAFNPESGWVCYGTTSIGGANGSNCTNGYDADGNLQSKTDARGITTTYGYDVLGRVLGKQYRNDPGNTPNSCLQYDASSVSNAVGRLTSTWKQSSGKACASSPPTSGVYTRRSILSYDVMGRVLNEQQCTFSNCSTGTSYSPQYTYDLSGELQTATNGIATTPSVGTLQFTYGFDQAARLQSITSNWSDSRHTASLFSAQSASPAACSQNSPAPSYSPSGELMNAILGNGLALSENYDNRLRLVCETGTGSIVANATSGTATVTITGSERTK